MPSFLGALSYTHTHTPSYSAGFSYFLTSQPTVARKKNQQLLNASKNGTTWRVDIFLHNVFSFYFLKCELCTMVHFMSVMFSTDLYFVTNKPSGKVE